MRPDPTLYLRDGWVPPSPDAPWPDSLVHHELVSDTRSDPRWRPLQISCDLVSPAILGPEGVHLDALLSYAAWRDYMELPEAQRWTMPPADTLTWVADFALPVATWIVPVLVEPGDADPRLWAPSPDGQRCAWGYCCSNVSTTWLSRERVAFRSKSPLNELRRYGSAKSVNISAGRFKGIDLAYEARVAHTLTWWALGDADGVARLLERVPHIGKKHNVGSGQIKADPQGRPLWRVEEADDDWSMMAADAPTRTLPWRPELGPGRMDSIRAPYWHPGKRLLAGGPYEP